MTSAMLTELLKSTGFLGVFLLIGVFLRAKVPIFQKTFMPASVIGGFLILILSPTCLGVLPVSEEWLSIYSLIPGILIVPVVASVPLGLTLGKGKSGEADVLKNIVPLMFIMVGVGIFQFGVGYLVHIIFKSFGYDFYATFGWEMGIGFSGGHGTAAVLGSMLSEANLPYWETAQGVAVTTATFGIVGGIIIGMILINWAARRGHTQLLDKPADIPHNIKVGYEKDITKQASVGRETTLSASVDVFAFHTAIIFAVCTLSYVLLGAIKSAKIPVLSDISIWAYAIIIMFAVWGIICKLKIDYLVDSKVKSKISGCLTEYAVIAAIASLPIKAVAAYIVPILAMVILGFIATTAFLVFFCKRYLKGFWFEQMIGAFGMSTGVFLTGVLLLRICDPELESPALGNYSLSYTVTSVIYFALLAFFLSLLVNQGIVMAMVISFAMTVVAVIGAVISSKICFGKDYKGN